VVAEGRQNRLLLAALLGLLLNLGGNLLLIPRFGAMGAAWMTVATEFLMLGFVAWSLRDLLPWLRLAWAAGLGTVGGILALALAQVTGPWGILMATGGALAWALAWDLLPRAEVARLWKAR
jgi:O-antigen/teichoic acid export membrane protein